MAIEKSMLIVYLQSCTSMEKDLMKKEQMDKINYQQK